MTNKELTGSYSVYVHILPKEVSGCVRDKYYFGVTSRKPYVRWGRGSHYKQLKVFYPVIQKYGWDNIRHLIVAEGLCEEVAKQMEVALIKMYHTQDRNYGYNVTNGGDGVSGVAPYNKGLKMDKEGRERCRQARLGKTMPESAKKKIASNSRIRWQEGGDFYEKYIKTNTMPFKNKRTYYKGFGNETAKRVMCFETKEIFGSASEAGRLGYGSFSTICAVCRGERKSHHKRHFMYVDDYLIENNIEYTDLLKEYKERKT